MAAEAATAGSCTLPLYKMIYFFRRSWCRGWKSFHGCASCRSLKLFAVSSANAPSAGREGVIFRSEDLSFNFVQCCGSGILYPYPTFQIVPDPSLKTRTKKGKNGIFCTKTTNFTNSRVNSLTCTVFFQIKKTLFLFLNLFF